MWFTRTTDGYNGWFAVVSSAGTLRTGLVNTDFTVTVRNPQDTTSDVPSVAESGKGGLYKFNITSSFLQAHGTGSYGVVVEVNATGPKLNDAFVEVLQVYESNFDSVSISTASIATIVSGSAAETWSAPIFGNTVSGTMGSLLLTASTGPTPVIDTGAIATAVWSEDITTYTTPGQAGNVIGSMSGSIQSISGSLSLVASDITFIKSIEGGRWKIINNQMIFYADDNVTEVARFNLFDSAGSPSEDAVFERVRV